MIIVFCERGREKIRKRERKKIAGWRKKTSFLEYIWKKLEEKSLASP